MEKVEKIKELVALNREQTPDEDYFEDFIGNFHDRQRQEMLQVSTLQLLRDRVETWLNGWNGRKWIGGGVAVASFAVVMLVLNSPKAENAQDDFGGELAVEEIDPGSLLREF